MFQTARNRFLSLRCTYGWIFPQISTHYHGNPFSLKAHFARTRPGRLCIRCRFLFFSRSSPFGVGKHRKSSLSWALSSRDNTRFQSIISQKDNHLRENSTIITDHAFNHIPDGPGNRPKEDGEAIVRVRKSSAREWRSYCPCPENRRERWLQNGPYSRYVSPAHTKAVMKLMVENRSRCRYM